MTVLIDRACLLKYGSGAGAVPPSGGDFFHSLMCWPRPVRTTLDVGTWFPAPPRERGASMDVSLEVQDNLLVSTSAECLSWGEGGGGTTP
jgi:hypothetical protein